MSHRLHDTIAFLLANSFVRKEISYETASGFFNQIMPVIGFDSASKIFWEFYVTFEDFETIEEPEEKARNKVKKLLEEKNVN